MGAAPVPVFPAQILGSSANPSGTITSSGDRSRMEALPRPSSVPPIPLADLDHYVGHPAPPPAAIPEVEPAEHHGGPEGEGLTTSEPRRMPPSRTNRAGSDRIGDRRAGSGWWPVSSRGCCRRGWRPRSRYSRSTARSASSGRETILEHERVPAQLLPLLAEPGQAVPAGWRSPSTRRRPPRTWARLRPGGEVGRGQIGEVPVCAERVR